MSVAGGVSKAVERAGVHGCEALQIFSKNANQWQGKPLDPGEIRAFPHAYRRDRHHAGRRARQLPDQPRHDVSRAARAVDRRLRRRARSRRRARTARRRHPSGHVHRGKRGRRPAADRGRHPRWRSRRGRGRRPWCCWSTRPARGARSAIGSSIWRPSSTHLDGSPRVGVCLDTCHLVASGYDIVSDAAIARPSTASTGSSASIA